MRSSLFRYTARTVAGELGARYSRNFTVPTPAAGSTIHTIAAGGAAGFNWAAVLPGHTVHVQSLNDGEAINIAASGSEEAPIFIIADPSLSPARHVSTSVAVGVNTQGNSNLVIKGLRIQCTGTTDGLVYYGNNLWIVENTLSYTSSATPLYGLLRSASTTGTGISLTNSNLYIVGNTLVADGTKTAEAIRVGANISANQSWTNVQIVGNSVIGRFREGIRLWKSAGQPLGSYIHGAVIAANLISGTTAGAMKMLENRLADEFVDPTGTLQDFYWGYNTVLNCASGLNMTGVTPSSDGWGSVVVENNQFRGLRNVNGGMNIWQCRYLWIRGNVVTDVDSGVDVIDGNGILLDRGNRFVRISGNRVSGCKWQQGIMNKGAGIMVLNSSDVEVYNNDTNYCGNGIHIASQFEALRIGVRNNSFRNCGLFKGHLDASVEEGSVSWSNNSGDGGVSAPSINRFEYLDEALAA